MRYLSLISRKFATQKLPKEKLKYTHTINLPKTTFPNFLNIEKKREVERFLLDTTFSRTYAFQQAHNKEPAFILHDGPPYANGDLHMGHAVNKILKDVTLRKWIAQGKKIHYVPGWDCHGLPIELKAITTKSAEELSKSKPDEIRAACRKFAMDAMQRQKNEFESWGIVSDWGNNNTYLTIDPKFMINELRIFLELFEKGLVFRDLKPVFWSPSSGSALAESELEYEEYFVSPSLFVRFQLNMPEKIASELGSDFKRYYALIWTTTPWTLPSNQAVCYNANLNYCLVQLTKPDGSVVNNELYLVSQQLIKHIEDSTNFKCLIKKSLKASDVAQLTYQHPINKSSKTMPLLEASHVLDTKGTGLVHTAPAHGHDDFLICLKHNISLVNLVDEAGRYNCEAPKELQNKEVLTDGNDMVLEMLKDDVVFTEKMVHSYPIDWRTKKPVIIRASEQWFIDTSSLKDKAVEEIGKVEIYPRVNAESSKKALEIQVMKRPYWCISRQRCWGVPIPAFYFKKTNKPFINAAVIERICDLINQAGNIDFWWTKNVEEILSKELLEKLNVKADDLIKGNDIFDIWFDSGSTWSSVLPNEQVADMYMEGYDQFSGWFQSSLLISVALRNIAPYKSLFVHGFAVDEKGRKMSKSLGNVVSPIDIVKQYGVDTLRWWVASHGTQNMSITVSDKLIKQSAENLGKFRSMLRYLKGFNKMKSPDLLPPFSPTSPNTNNHLNKYLLSQLVGFDNEVSKYYDAFEFNRATAVLLAFLSNQLSGTYVHLIKDRLYCGDNDDFANVRFTLAKCYEILCKSLYPIAPFLIEESWTHYDPNSPFHEQCITLDPAWKNEDLDDLINTVLQLKQLINQSIGSTNTWLLDVNVTCKNDKVSNILSTLHQNPINSELAEILQVGGITLQTAATSAAASVASTADNNFEVVVIAPEKEKCLCPRCRRFTVSIASDLCQRCDMVLKNKRPGP